MSPHSRELARQSVAMDGQPSVLPRAVAEHHDTSAMLEVIYKLALVEVSLRAVEHATAVHLSVPACKDQSTGTQPVTKRREDC